MKSVIKALKKTVIFIVGMAVLGLGLVLIPAPGPGLLVVVAGLFILSIEFEWAKSYLHKARQQLEAIRRRIKEERQKKFPDSAKDVDRPRDHKGKGKRRN